MEFNFKKKEQNIFVAFLDLLNVKHNKSFSNQFYGEHPHKNNMYGLSRMLSDYGIENAGIKIENKEIGLLSLEVPFIAHAGGDFVTVFKVTLEKVFYLWNGKEILISQKDFHNIWSGVVLLAEPDEYSIEPNFKENKKKEIWLIVQRRLLISLISVLALLSYFVNQLYNNWGLSLSLLVNLIGVYIGFLLIQKQLHIHSNYADKICSLFKKGDCNDVLASEAAKLWGVIGWSEVGFGYFISNMLVVLLMPKLISYLAVINLVALPYSFWSVWYQKVKAKQWCLLCLIVQMLLWLNLVIDVIFGFLQMPALNFSYLLIGCIYLIPFLIISLTLPVLIAGGKVMSIAQEINSLKASEDVFNALLKKQPYYEVGKSTSKILFGNPDAKILITILTNPHCEPCAKMHTRVEKLLEEAGDRVCIQYIFSSFDKNLDSSNKFLIAAYFKMQGQEVEGFYNVWFKGGKYRREEIFENYNYSLDYCEIAKEFQSHEEWKEKTKLRATPTILVNGFELPKNYKIEDFAFLDFAIDNK